jgi:hypothetical protein
MAAKQQNRAPLENCEGKRMRVVPMKRMMTLGRAGSENAAVVRGYIDIALSGGRLN